MSQISNLDLFKAVNQATIRYGEKGLIPDSYVSTNTPLYRSVPNHRIALTATGLITAACADGVISPWDGNPNKDNNNNRFSGINPLPVEKRFKEIGGMYLFRDENAGLAEMMHYSEQMNSLPVNIKNRRVSIPHLMATKTVFTIYPRKSLRLANLSIHRDGANVTKFLDAIEDDSSVKSLLRGAKLIDKILDPIDYTVSRAFAFAFAAIPYFDGLESQTARDSDRQGWVGDNTCIFGVSETPIPFLNPDSALLTFSSASLYNQNGEMLNLSEKNQGIINNLSPNFTQNEQTLKIEVENSMKSFRL